MFIVFKNDHNLKLIHKSIFKNCSYENVHSIAKIFIDWKMFIIWKMFRVLKMFIIQKIDHNF
jgi:hypothetical protein